MATAAAVLLLAGCGDDDNNDSDASSSSSSSSSSAESSESSSPSDDVEAFCRDAEGALSGLGEFDENTDPSQLAPQLAEAADAFDSVEPPTEIAEDWAVLADALRNWAEVSASVDLATPDGQSQFQQAGQDFMATASGPSGQAVDEFGGANCS